MPWDPTLKPCIATYGILIEKGQIDGSSVIDDIGTLKMSDLQFFNTAAGNGILNGEAQIMAKNIDTTCTESFNGTYKGAANMQSAIAAFKAVLVDADKTVTNLSDAIAAVYDF